MSASVRVDPKNRPIKTYRFVYRTMRFRMWLYLFNSLSMIVIVLAGQVPGLLIKQFFDDLTGKAGAAFNMWTIVALLAACAVARVVGFWGLIRANVPFMVINHTLFHKNLLGRIFQRPGAKALPESPGEAINRFKNDVEEIPLFALWMNDLMGSALAAIFAVVAMLSINVTITLV